jgi:hypothetical protein
VTTAHLTTPTATQLQVRWTAAVARRAGGHARMALTIALRTVDAQHLLVEAWIETPDGPRSLFERRPIAGSIVRDGGYLHVDANHDGRRLIALTLGDQGPGGGGPSALYAHSCLLRDAGLRPGAFDPPSVRLIASEDAASA